MDIVQRYDLAGGSVGAHRRTPQGGLIADARLTRTGVFKYVQPDGTTRRELRHPDDVFHPDSLASLAHAPVTIDHPEVVTPNNWKDVAVGHVAGTPKQDGKYVTAPIRIHDRDAIDDAEKGKLQELSCGYSCKLDRTPGTYDGEAYDAVQRTIRYNHVAAGPPGWGRAGPEVRMRFDASSAVSLDDENTTDERTDDMDDRFSENSTYDGPYEEQPGDSQLHPGVAAHMERNANAWRTGRAGERLRGRRSDTTGNGYLPRGDGKTRPDVLANAIRAWERCGRKGPKPTDEAPDPTAASQTPSRRGNAPIDEDDPLTPEEYDFSKTNREAGEGDSVGAAQARMVQRNKDAWKASGDRRAAKKSADRAARR
ncbi:MAG TPA: DUF2213 domain-containing protein [Polyangiaceae bacterium]|jgi:hypothetical protein